MTSQWHVNVSELFLTFSISHDISPGPEMAIKHQFVLSYGTIVWYKIKFIQFHGIGDTLILTPEVNMTEIFDIQGQKKHSLVIIRVLPYLPHRLQSLKPQTPNTKESASHHCDSPVPRNSTETIHLFHLFMGLCWLPFPLRR